ncbi:MAG TPA: CHASE4 domain-containing protein, partial [Candidatus Omnitrophota bacterium]|nr:CHASE4 domain-containing protein [Candidatus Omnitrophota bacterium]
PNDKFIKSNLVDLTFKNLKINLILFAHIDGKIIYAKSYDLTASREVAVPPWFKENRAGASRLFDLRGTDSATRGFINLPEGLMLVVSRPVIRSNGTGPIKGAVLFGKFIDRNEINRLSASVGLTVEAFGLKDPALADHLNQILSQRSAAGPYQPYIRPVSGTMVEAYQPVRDIFGDPALVFRISSPRTIYNQGQTALLTFSLIFFLFMLTTIVAIVIVIERTMLSRLMKMSAEVRALGRSGNIKTRLKVEGKDEISNLSGSMNNMLEAIGSAQSDFTESEKKFQKLFESIPEAIFLETLEGKIIDCNLSAVNMSGYSKEELLRLSAANLVPGDVSGEFPRLIETTVTLGSSSLEAFNRRKNGEVFPVDVTMVAIEMKGVKYMLVVVRDVTDKKRIEKEFKERVSELEKFQKLTIDRELKMIELEKEVNALLAELGRERKY